MILVVNQIRTLRKITVSNLKGLGYTDIMEADDPSQVIELIDRKITLNWIVIELFDIVMSPEENALLKILKVRKKNLGFSVVVTIPEDNPGLIDDLSAMGFDNYIIKSLENLPEYTGKLKRALSVAEGV